MASNLEAMASNLIAMRPKYAGKQCHLVQNPASEQVHSCSAFVFAGDKVTCLCLGASILCIYSNLPCLSMHHRFPSHDQAKANLLCPHSCVLCTPVEYAGIT